MINWRPFGTDIKLELETVYTAITVWWNVLHSTLSYEFSLYFCDWNFKVIDEADRMIDSMHQSWLKLVTQAVYRKGADVSIFGRREPGPITAARCDISAIGLVINFALVELLYFSHKDRR